jgi:hypothetical protein
MTVLMISTLSHANSCITKAEALELARVNIESHNNTIDTLRESEINLEDVISDMEFNGFNYLYSSYVNPYTIEDITVSCLGDFNIVYYYED